MFVITHAFSCIVLGMSTILNSSAGHGNINGNTMDVDHHRQLNLVKKAIPLAKHREVSQ